MKTRKRISIGLLASILTLGAAGGYLASTVKGGFATARVVSWQHVSHR